MSSTGTVLHLTRGKSLALYPADQAAEETLKRFAPGELVPVEVWKERNARFHKKYFALINLVYQNQEDYKNETSFRAAVTVAAGYYREYYSKERQEMIKYPESIAWKEMDELKFEKLYSATIDVILSQFLPGMDRKDLEEEVARFA